MCFNVEIIPSNWPVSWEKWINWRVVLSTSWFECSNFERTWPKPAVLSKAFISKNANTNVYFFETRLTQNPGNLGGHPLLVSIIARRNLPIVIAKDEGYRCVYIILHVVVACLFQFQASSQTKQYVFIEDSVKYYLKFSDNCGE